DRRDSSVTVFNDRYAMGRIYYCESDEEFIFSSEAKSLLRARPRLRLLSEEALAEHLRYNCVLGDRSLFANIRRFPHASAWKFTLGRPVQRRRYFEFREWEEQPELGPEEFYGRWCDTVSEVFPNYAEEGARVALSLTAGLDTRLILAALRKSIRQHPV